MTTRIEAGRLIPGRGEVVDDGVVVLDDSTITYSGAASDAPATPDAGVIETDTVKSSTGPTSAAPGFAGCSVSAPR